MRLAQGLGQPFDALGGRGARWGRSHRHDAIPRWSFDWFLGSVSIGCSLRSGIPVPRIPDAERSSVSRVSETGTHSLKGGYWRQAR